MPKMVRINTGKGWQTVTLTDEEVEKVTKENMEYNVNALLECIRTCKSWSEVSGVEPALNEDCAKTIYQSAFAKPLIYALKEYALANCDRPSHDQMQYLSDLCRDLGIDVPDVKKNEISPLIETLKVLRTKKGQKSTGTVKTPAASSGACEVCGTKEISAAVEAYSLKNFDGRLLCYDCQQAEKHMRGDEDGHK